MNEPRNLTVGEINSILDEVVPLENNHMFIQKDPVAKREMIENIRVNLREQLRYVKIIPSGIPLLKTMIEQKLVKSLSQPGYMVGITVAESFGQEVSQAALNSKRLTGAGNDIAGGLNAVKAVLNGSKGAIAPANIFFKNPYFTLFDVYRMASYFTQITLQDLTKYSELLLDDLVEKPEWFDLHEKIYGKMKFTPKYIIRVYLDMEKVYNHQVTIGDIIRGIMNFNENDMLYPVASPLTEDKPYVDVYLNEDKMSSDINKSSEIFYSTIFTVKDISIKGVPHLLKMTPVYVEMTNCIHRSTLIQVSNEDIDAMEEIDLKKKLTKKKKEEMLSNMYYVVLNYHFMDEFGIPREKLEKLMEACGMEIVPLKIGKPKEFMVVKCTEKPEKFMANQIVHAVKEQDKEFNNAISKNSTSIPPLNEIYRLGRQYYSRVKMDKEKDKMLKILSPLACYKIIDIHRSNSGDMYENLHTLGVLGLKNYLNKKIATLISGAGGNPVWMHVNIMTNYMTHLGFLTRFNLKGVEQGSGGMFAGVLWKDNTRIITRASAAGVEANKGSLALFKMTGGGGNPGGTKIVTLRNYTKEELAEMLEREHEKKGNQERGEEEKVQKKDYQAKEKEVVKEEPVKKEGKRPVRKRKPKQEKIDLDNF